MAKKIYEEYHEHFKEQTLLLEKVTQQHIEEQQVSFTNEIEKLKNQENELFTFIDEFEEN